MLGAIAGDVIGSVYEGNNVKSTEFGPLFQRFSRPTDDTVLTCAVAEWLLRGAGDDLPDRLKSWFRSFPYAGYGGGGFPSAATSPPEPLDSLRYRTAAGAGPVRCA